MKPTTDNTSIKKFVRKTNKAIADKIVSEGEYCIVVQTYKGDIYDTNKSINIVYKNIADFIERYENDIKNIDPELGTFFQLWTFS